jgi:hypothetical protein
LLLRSAEIKLLFCRFVRMNISFPPYPLKKYWRQLLLQQNFIFPTLFWGVFFSLGVFIPFFFVFLWVFLYPFFCFSLGVFFGCFSLGVFFGCFLRLFSLVFVMVFFCLSGGFVSYLETNWGKYETNWGVYEKRKKS